MLSSPKILINEIPYGLKKLPVQERKITEQSVKGEKESKIQLLHFTPWQTTQFQIHLNGKLKFLNDTQI